jgi:Tol biopolymer transport system component
MKEERRRAIMQLFEAAAELPPDQRAALLESSEPEIAQEVRALLSDMDASRDSIAPLAWRPPHEIGRYVVAELLGRGGMGEVWSARDTALDRMVALKFLNAGALGGGSPERLMREAKAVSALNHPNIVTLYEVIESGDRLAIAMELVQGAALRNMTGAALAISDLVRIGRQVAEALAAAHAQNIIHRDIKPENVMVRSDGYVKLLDFGLARRVGAGWKSTDGLAAGTLRYMSPEQARGDRLTAATDVFSLGVVLYELATGRHPFPGDSAYETAHAILTDEPVPAAQINRALPERLVALIHTMLRKDPAIRPAAAEIVRELNESASQGSISGRESVAPPNSSRMRRLPATLVAGTVCIAGLLIFLWTRTARNAGDSTAPNVLPVVTASGFKDYPTLSPDGSQIAFTWNGNNPAGGLDLYVKVIGAGDPLRLTTSPEDDILPSWSPDGRYIAFSRRVEGIDRQAIYIIPALGGAERRITDAGVGISWSPDSETLVLVRRPKPEGSGGLFLYSLKTGAQKDLTEPGAAADSLPAFSPDGRWIAFTRVFAAYAREVFVVPAQGGSARQLTFDKSSTNGAAWTSDSREIIFSSGRLAGHDSLWRIPVSGGTPARIMSGSDNTRFPTISRRGDRLAFSEMSTDSNIYRYEGPGFTDAAAPSALDQPKVMIDSSRPDVSPSFSPDGKRIAFASGRSGSMEIWTCDLQGGRLLQVTSFGGPLTGSPRWSPDGRQIAFRSQPAGTANIFVVSADGGPVRQLTSQQHWDDMPAWSVDGTWIYFISNRSGDPQVWKLEAAGGTAVQVTKTGAFDALPSPDGRLLYFTKSDKGIWSMPVEGGTEQPVPGLEHAGGTRSWGVVPQGIYFAPDREEHPAVQFYSFQTRKISRLTTLNQRVYARQPSIALAPDGRTFLFARVDRDTSDLMLIDGFH